MRAETCSAAPGALTWRGMSFKLTAALSLLGLALAGPLPALADEPVPVETAQVRRQDVAEFARGVGTVQAYNNVLIRARVDGTIVRIAFREGQDVKAGDLLVVIDPRPYAATLAQAEAKRAADEALLENAKRDLVRYTNLARTNFASRQQLDTQTATVAQDTANLQADEAAIATAQLNLSFCSITSPIDGVVGLRQVDIGNLVHATDSQGIVTVAQVQPIALVFTLSADDIERVREAMRSGPPLVLATTTDGATVLSRGTLLTPNNTVDTSTGTIALKAIFANTDRKLWPGQPVGARIRLAIDHDAIAVPPNAVQHGPDGLYVYVVGADHRVAKRDVQIGYEDDQVAVIKDGLAAGETVVTAGQVRLQPGVLVAADPQPKS